MIKILTEYERLNLLNQYKILRDLAEIKKDEDSVKYYDELATIVSEGYVLDYGQLTEELNDEFPETECSFVWDTLSMNRAIHDSYNKIRNPQISKEEIRFDGFDGNEEFRYYNLCNHIILTLKHFSEQTEDGRRDFNSHFRRCAKYREMLNKWQSMGKPYNLSESDIQYLIS